MKEFVTLDDISLVPADFSMINSRADVKLNQTISKTYLQIPLVSSNMTSVYSPKLSQEVLRLGGQSIVHRFCSIEENVKLFTDGIFVENLNTEIPFSQYNPYKFKPWVSVGNGKSELDRASALVYSGADTIVLDLAMGSSMLAVKQFQELSKLFPNCDIVVSDFSTRAQLQAFVGNAGKIPTSFTIGQGAGSSCQTRLKTGIGVPTATMITDCVESGFNIILNGGIKNPGDAAKALALGVKAVMVGRLFAACHESGAKKLHISKESRNLYPEDRAIPLPSHAIYRGSAAASSYEDQGKTSSNRTPEGEEYTIPVTGTVEDLMNDFNGGLRSSLSYLNANNLDEFRKNVRFIKLTQSGMREAHAYGKHE